MGKSNRNSQDNWLVTYSDLVTLILTFFVLLYTMTSGVEEKAFNSFLQYFQKHSSFLPEAAAVTESILNQVDPEILEKEAEEQMERWQAFVDFLEEQQLSDVVEVNMIIGGIKITLSDSLTFDSGSSALLPKAKEVLNKVADLMIHKVEEIEVQGHTDDVPIARDSFYRTNWHLGAARAVSVVQYLHQSSNMEASRFKAASFGEYRPVASNDTPEGRLRNRRVEIYLRDKLIQEEINPFEGVFSTRSQENRATF